MPFVRRKAPRRRYNRYRRSRTTSSKYVARIARRVYMNNTETKTKDYVYNNVGAAPGGDFSSISYGGSAIVAGLAAGITQGVDEFQRIGRKIFIRGVRIYFTVQGNDAFNHTRFMLVSPKHGGDYADFGGSIANFITGVMSNAASSSTQYAYPIDTRTFHVLWDHTLSFAPHETSAGTFTTQPKVLKKFIKINKSTYWTEGNNSTAQREWYLVAISDSVAVPHPGVIAGNVKVYYKDG